MMTKEEFKAAFVEQFDSLSNDEVVALHNAYCDDRGYGDDFILSTDDFDYYYDGSTPTEIALAVRCGDYNPNHDWFQFNGYANPVSTDFPSDFVDPYSIAGWAYDNGIDLYDYGFDIDIYDDEDCDNDEE